MCVCAYWEQLRSTLLLNSKYVIQCVCSQLLRCVQLFATPWTVTSQDPLHKEFSRQEYWSGLPFTTLGDLPKPRIKPACLACLHWQVASLQLCHLGSPVQCSSVNYSHYAIPSVFGNSSYYNWRHVPFYQCISTSSPHSFPCPTPRSWLLPFYFLFLWAWLFSIKNSTCKWWHSVFVFLCLADFTHIMSFRFIHAVANVRTSFFSPGWIIFYCILSHLYPFIH